jgi:hypothetical protein
MEATISGKNYLNQFFTGFTTLILLGLEILFGSGINTLVFGDVARAHFHAQIGGAGKDFLFKP